MKLFAAIALTLAVFAAHGISCASQVIYGDAVWSGVVRVDGVVEVVPGAKLTIMPGTIVMFAKGELNDEDLADTALVASGDIIAEGTPDARITFTSAESDPAPGDWGEIRAVGSTGSRFVNCDFRFGGWALHVHDSAVLVEGCTITDNAFGGIRGKGGEVEISGCTLTGMELGIRYWQGAPYIHGNTITGNMTGIFFRQACDGARVEFNNLYGNHEYDFKLGDAYDMDIAIPNNWWGATDEAVIRARIFDRQREEYIGSVDINPVLPAMHAD